MCTGMTNYEKIKNMSIEEMAEGFERLAYTTCPCYCSRCLFNHKGYLCDKTGFIGWLNSEVEE